MATYIFSAITNNETISFNPTKDTLEFDNTTISASSGSVTLIGANSLLFDYLGKSFTLSGVVFGNISSTNIKFSNGSKFLIGDGLATTLDDDKDNLLKITSGNLGDYLNGMGGNDTLDGGLGPDFMVGGSGNDLYYVDDPGDIVTEDDDDLDQIDTVHSKISYVLSDNLENLTLLGTSKIDGTGNDLENTIEGNSGDNLLCGLYGDDYLFGGDGNDTLDGGASVCYSDTMSGGNGNDIYIVDSLSDIAIETSPSGGIDTVQSSVSFILGDNLENLELTGTYAINGTGNQLNNKITGNSKNNTLYGGTGADTLTGGDGNDTYIVNSADDKVIEETNPPTSNQDIVKSSVSWTLAANIENLQLMGLNHIDATGNEINNILYANAGNNVFDGKDGIDTVSYELLKDSTNYSTPAFIGVDVSLAETDAQDTRGSGIDTLKNIENLIGSQFNDRLTGNSGDNILNGSKGSDVLIGGDGNDTYYVDGADLVIETNNDVSQIDTVISIVDYVIGSNIENLTLDGTAINATGNELKNVITGNSKANLLNGMEGADKLIGGAGDDQYIVDGLDTVTESVGGGIDMIIAPNISWDKALPANVENLMLLGSFELTGKGNNLANIIYSNVGNSKLDGGVNSSATYYDTVSYEYGSISGVTVDLSKDTPQSTGGSGTDTLKGFSNVTGTSYDDVFTGTTGNNVFNGMDGIDTVSYANAASGVKVDLNSVKQQDTGGAGKDTLVSIENLIGSSSYDDIFIASPGNNSFYGGLQGSDTVSYASTKYAVTVDLTITSPQNTLGSGFDKLVDIENLTGSSQGFKISGVMVYNNDTLKGDSKNNILDGGLGDDTMTGGAGNDTYYVDSLKDVVTETSTVNKEIDTVNSSVNYVLGDNLENLTLMGTTAINGTGNALDNYIMGNTNSNIIYGNAGNDTIDGGVGNDTIDGGVGNDTIDGGAGNDTIGGGAGNDTFVFASGIDTISDSAGTDMLKFGGTIAKERIAFFKASSSPDLLCDIGSGDNNRVTVTGQANTATAVEKFIAPDGYWLSSSDVTKVLQDMTKYATDHSIQLTGIDNVIKTPELMAIIISAWHAPA